MSNSTAFPSSFTGIIVPGILGFVGVMIVLICCACAIYRNSMERRGAARETQLKNLADAPSVATDDSVA